MGTMIDAVNPANIPTSYNGGPAVRISCLAAPQADCYDVEPGNAPLSEVVPCAKAQVAANWPVILYLDRSDIPAATAALTAAGLSWKSASQWPEPGVYLWVAWPGWTPAFGLNSLPVDPIAIQNGYYGDYDTSFTFSPFPGTVAGYIDGSKSEWPADAWDRFTSLHPAPAPQPTPAPTPAPQGDIEVNVPQLQSGSSGGPVAAVQRLLSGLTIDGIFGPKTEAAVRTFQTDHKLAVDGIVGVHTWGSLVGAPQ